MLTYTDFFLGMSWRSYYGMTSSSAVHISLGAASRMMQNSFHSSVRKENLRRYPTFLAIRLKSFHVKHVCGDSNSN
ncbi:hypothetical protein PAHAL_6G207600 [Panicum hallii]|uniref:Uncharacterized protein n=1 Tax=Panicum hallii TaxID=206008 RepID=A0A2T8IH11_9POAL|nr:hypothetical protein PAHAL_6G207600 [Panicum hallii]